MPDHGPSDGRTDSLAAADVMTASPRTCSPSSTITEASLIFRDEGCGAVPVIDEGRPVGILTDRDVALAVAPYPDLHRRPVSDVMTKAVVTVALDDRLQAIRAKFSEAGVHRLLVIDAGGTLAGIIALSDLASRVREGQVGLVGAVESPHPGGGADRPRPDPAGDPAPNRRTGGPDGRWGWARPGAFWGLLRTTAREWSEDKVPRLGAALAFYSVLSIAPLLLIAIAVAAMIFGQEAASGQLVGQIRGMVGEEGAEAIQEMLKNARKPGAGLLASIVGFATLLLGASGVFGQLQDAMNTIWEVQPKEGRGILGMLKDRFLSFTMVLGTGFLLLTSLILSTAVVATFGSSAAWPRASSPCSRRGTSWSPPSSSRCSSPSSTSCCPTPGSPGETSGWARG